MSDEQKLKSAKAVYATLCQMLDDNQWHYKKDEEKLRVETGAKGDDLPMHIRIDVDAKRQLVVLISPMLFEVPENRRKELSVAVSAANYPIVDGNFDYDYKNGIIAFRMVASFLDSLIGKDLLEYIFMCSCATIDEYNDKFLKVVESDMSYDEIIEFFK